MPYVAQLEHKLSTINNLQKSPLSVQHVPERVSAMPALQEGVVSRSRIQVSTNDQDVENRKNMTSRSIVL